MEFLADVNHHNVSVHLDTYHMNVGGRCRYRWARQRRAAVPSTPTSGPGSAGSRCPPPPHCTTPHPTHGRTHARLQIEEASFEQAVRLCGDRLGYVHIGESHRWGPEGQQGLAGRLPTGCCSWLHNATPASTHGRAAS